MHKKSALEQFLTSWHLWIMVALVIGAFILQKFVGGSTVFLFALILMCPIMMMFMMRDHKHK